MNLLDDLINDVCGKHSSPILILSDDKLGMSTFINPRITTLQKNGTNLYTVTSFPREVFQRGKIYPFISSCAIHFALSESIPIHSMVPCQSFETSHNCYRGKPYQDGLFGDVVSLNQHLIHSITLKPDRTTIAERPQEQKYPLERKKVYSVHSIHQPNQSVRRMKPYGNNMYQP